jgi:hypothetical protein
MRLSASRLNMWQTCSMQAYLHYVERLPSKQNAKASFGTVVHHALEYYHHSMDVEGAVRMFKRYWESPELLGVTPEVWPKLTTYGGLREQGIEVIREYANKNQWDPAELIGSEVEFLVPFGPDHELYGFIDMLRVKKMGNGRLSLLVTDLKTNARQPTRIDLALNLQFTIYMYVVQQKEFWLGHKEISGVVGGEEWWPKVPKMSIKGIWYHLMTNKELPVGKRDEDDFNRVYRLATQIQKADEAGIYLPKIGEACLWCPYTKQCGITIPSVSEEEVMI